MTILVAAWTQIRSSISEHRFNKLGEYLGWGRLALAVLNGWCMHKTYFQIMVIMLPLAALVATVMNKLKVQVPVGYQDENGFHVGTGRAENKVNWPPFW